MLVIQGIKRKMKTFINLVVLFRLILFVSVMIIGMIY